jgi:GrpB-like predicted nucleotidyltransferase (UPF0157 family)
MDRAKLGELARASRLARELERDCQDPREPILGKVRRMQRTRSPELPPGVRALRSYDPSWAALFAGEERRIRAARGGAVARIEHFGSSAVPSSVLTGKNVIDFLVALREIPGMETDAAFEALGYTPYGNSPCDPEAAWWWRIEGDEVAYVAHLCDAANPWIETAVNFRDYLRAHPEECRRYQEVKQSLAAEPDRSLFEYSLGKLRLFYDISGKANAWKARQS